MSYLSPFQLLDLQLGPEGLSAQDLRRAKKRLLAELELSPGQQLQLGGKKLSKDELLRLFDQLENPKERDFHQRIYRHKALLQFLEYGQLSYLKDQDTFLKKQENAQLAAFVAPFFAEQYSEILLAALRAKDAEALAALPPAERLVPEQHAAACYQEGYYFVRDHKLRIIDLPEHERASYMTERELLFELEKDSLLSYNALPHYFQGTRDAFAESLAETAIEFIRRHGRVDAARALLRRGKLLQLSENGEKALQQAKQRIPGNVLSGFLGSGVPLWLLIGVGVVVFLFVLKYLENTFF